MSRVAVRGLYLNYPLYGQSRHAAMEGKPVGDDEAEAAPTRSDQLIRRRNGAVTGVRALTNISFEAKSGERLALVGENGSGKTTLLQALAGIYTPDAGEIEIEGRSTSVVNINLGMSLEASGHRNITLRGLASGRSRQEIEDKRAEIAAFSELGSFLDLPIETYSAGMRMRLNFAIATAFDPDVLILDEWLSAGDTAFRRKATERMKAFVGKAGILILASHSKSLLTETCTRAIWLDAGTVRMDGPVSEVLEAYDAEMTLRQKRRDLEASTALEAARAAAQEASNSLQDKYRFEHLDRNNPIVRLLGGAYRALRGIFTKLR